MTRRGRPLRLLIVYANEAATRTLSYQHGWPRAFLGRADVTPAFLNLAERGALAEARAAWQLKWCRFDGIVLLHSVFSNVCYLSDRIRRWLASSSTPKVYFLGNEHKQLPQKIALAKELQLALLVTMLHHPRAVAGYAERVGCAVMALPSAGVDPDIFLSHTSDDERPIDIGYRAYDAPVYLGHRERSEIAERIGSAARARGLVCDISLDPTRRFDEAGWAAFLARCRGQIGTEAGGDYLDFDDARRLAVNAALAESPDLPFEELVRRFFADRVVGDGAGRALSGRIPEAAVAGCAHIMLRGHYAGYFEPDVHYIALDHDYRNLEDCLDRFVDAGERARLVTAARMFALERLTYRALVSRFVDRIATIV
jgi:hypothetical protein